jgi:tRNA(adenine34) deaminase
VTKTDRHEGFMRQALALGEFPTGAIVVLEDRVLAGATTSEWRERRQVGHPELVALERADRMGLSYDKRRKSALCTNLEPCLMCMGASVSFFLGEIVYGLESPGDGAVELVQGWTRKEEDLPGYRGLAKRLGPPQPARDSRPRSFIGTGQRL